MRKKKSKKAIKEKFNTVSDIIDNLDWQEGPDRYYAYAMLKKDFEFLKEFDKLGKFSFNNSEKQFDFFGINENSDKSLNGNLSVLFYNNKDDFAVKLNTKTDDEIYLYKTKSKDSFKNLYKKMKKDGERYSGNKHFENVDTLKIPNLKFKNEKTYNELCNKTIEGTDLRIGQAIETIEMELNSKGGRVKSEAIIMTLNAMIVENNSPRHFDFDETFVMFLVDKGKNNPYLALQINDLSKFVK